MCARAYAGNYTSEISATRTGIKGIAKLRKLKYDEVYTSFRCEARRSVCRFAADAVVGISGSELFRCLKLIWPLECSMCTSNAKITVIFLSLREVFLQKLIVNEFVRHELKLLLHSKLLHSTKKNFLRKILN